MGSLEGSKQSGIRTVRGLHTMAYMFLLKKLAVVFGSSLLVAMAACSGPPESISDFNKGQGKTAPPLVGIAKTFPDVSKQIAVITNGQSTMPAWKGKLSTADIAAVAAYSRTL